MAHPLDGALAHIERADRDFDELKAILDVYQEANASEPLTDEYLGILERVPNVSQPSVLMNIGLPSPDLGTSILISAIVHHLRVSLDYLVYELAINDAGCVKDGTQFVIADTKADIQKSANNFKSVMGFDSRAKRELAGLTPDHIGMIEDLQPYRRCEWTAILRDLSNQDKHRALILTTAYRQTSFEIPISDPLMLDKGKHMSRRGRLSGKKMQAEAQSTVFVVFEQWKHIAVIEMIDVLKARVRNTLNAFTPEFK